MRIKFFICFLILSVSLKAQTSVSSLLWEISGNGLQKPSYIYGTMHYPDKRIMELGDSVMPKLMTCEVMAGELDLNQRPDKETAQRILLPQGTTLSSLLSNEDYALVKKMTKKRLGLLYNMIIDKCKPIYVYFLLMQTESKKAKNEIVIDEYFQKEAKKNKKQVVGLESVDEQLSALDAINMEDQIKILTDYIHNGEQGTEETEQMIEIYLSQDLEKLDSFVVQSEMTEEMEQSILLKRNYLMAERSEKLIKNQPTFIAIGAAHLPGQEGVLELLRKQGYTIRPVISSSKSQKKSKKKRY